MQTLSNAAVSVLPKHVGRYRKATVLPRQARERCRRAVADICHAQAEATVSAFSMPDAGHESDHNINFTLACGGIASRLRRYPIGHFKKLSGIVVGCVNRLTGRYLAGRRQVKAWFLVLRGPAVSGPHVLCNSRAFEGEADIGECTAHVSGLRPNLRYRKSKSSPGGEAISQPGQGSRYED